ncbi:MAG: hypothetical protein ACOYO9_10480 [Candidatus Nanopelagicales bacterium]
MADVTVRLRTASLACASALVLVASGCASQMSALAPVGGDNIFKVRTATIDVLLGEGLALKVVPTCVQEAEAVVCEGTTMDDAKISVTAPGKGTTTMAITVGGVVVYDGSVQAIIDAAAGQS